MTVFEASALILLNLGLSAIYIIHKYKFFMHIMLKIIVETVELNLVVKIEMVTK